MAKNELYEDGDYISLAVPAGVLSGAPVVVGQIPAVAQKDRESDGTASLALKGVFTLQVAVAVAVGDIIYATVAGGLVTALNTTNTGVRFGYALAAQAGAGQIPVKIGW